MNRLINNSDERITNIVNYIQRLRKSLVTLRENLKKRALNNEIYLTDRELSELLKVSRRTLQEWRYKKRTPYIQIGGKILYRQRDIQEMLKKNYRAV